MPLFKAFLLYLLLFTTSQNSNAQIPAIAYQKNLGGSDGDEANAIHPTSDGGFITIGHSTSSDGDFAVNMGYDDIWVTKLDSALNVQWKRSYGGSSADIGMEILQTSGGGYLFTGRTFSNDNDVTGNHGLSDIWVVRLDDAGNIQWQRCYGGSYHEFTYNGNIAISLTSDGGFVVVGASYSSDGDVTLNHGQTDVWVFKADNAGNIQWQKSYGGSSWDEAHAVQQTAEGGYIVAGDTKSDDGDVTGRPFPLSLYEDIWVLKLDSAGNLDWQKCLGGSDYDEATKVIQLNDLNYMVTGYTGSYDGDITQSFGGWDGWIVKLDTAGTLVGQQNYGGNSYDKFYNLFPVSDGFIAAGTIGSTDVPGLRGLNDFWIVKLDSAFSVQWQKCYGGTSTDQAFDIDLLPTGYVLCGYSYSKDIDLLNNKGYRDMWLVKLVSHFNLITGQVYLDTLTNGLHDAGEPLLPNKLISESTTGRMVFTDLNGKYDLPVLTAGSYSVQAPAVNYYTVSPSAYPVTFASIDGVDSLNDFPAAPIPGMNDLKITLVASSEFNPGGYGTYWLICKNVGTSFLSGTAKIFPGNYLTYSNSSVTPILITPDSVIWNNINLASLQEEIITVEFSVSISAPLGTIIGTSCLIEPFAGDLDISNNTDEWRAAVTGSYDPNDKIVSDTVLTTTQLSLQPYLDYFIRFQNTGTDTAVNVMITDNIRNTLDISTFEFENASHPVQLEYQPASRLVTFHFNNIQLPDSNANEPASHGFVHYRINPLETLAAGNTIKNRAVIFFDFNLPVITNSAVTEIVDPVSVEENKIVFTGLTLYPDPASEYLTVLSKEE